MTERRTTRRKSHKPVAGISAATRRRNGARTMTPTGSSSRSASTPTLAPITGANRADSV
jgi:hypothetical protein